MKSVGHKDVKRSPFSLGSVNTPVIADTAAVSGLTLHIPASAVPERPSKPYVERSREAAF